MRICDRCRKNATNIIHFDQTHEHYDLCKECYEGVCSFVRDEKMTISDKNLTKNKQTLAKNKKNVKIKK